MLEFLTRTRIVLTWLMAYWHLTSGLAACRQQWQHCKEGAECSPAAGRR